jgi:SAM-dependent methyltransferase
VPAGGRVLDLASGTGRLTRFLRRAGYQVVALDYSWPMIRRTYDDLAPAAPTGAAVQGDGFAQPFAAGVFDAVVALRFAFHWRELAPFLTAAAEVAAPGAPIVFDTYVWTPRALVALDSTRWGGKVFTHQPAAVRALAARGGLTVEAEEHAFLCSPYVYRLLPLAAVRLLERAEQAVPAGWLCRVFWRLRRQVPSAAPPAPRSTTGSAASSGACAGRRPAIRL